MGGVAERTEVGVVGCFDEDSAAGLGEAVDFLDRRDDVFNVLDDVYQQDAVETAVAKRQRAAIDVGDDVGSGVAVVVDA